MRQFFIQVVRKLWGYKKEDERNKEKKRERVERKKQGEELDTHLARVKAEIKKHMEGLK